ncbi:MAG: adenosylcobinamide-GDP ribazoletransferase [Pseudomonadota bacterium]
MATFLLALQFLTRWPVKTDQLYSPARMAAAVRYYPLVGICVGGLSASVFLFAALIFPAPIAILLAITAGLIVTGAFHEDGLADTFDGIGGGLTQEKSLEIMRDSRLGTYGTLALLMMLAVKVAALISLPPSMVPLALISAHGLSRLSSITVIATSRYVRAEGTGKPVSQGVSPLSFLIAMATGGLLMVIWGVFHPPMVLIGAMGGLILGHILMRLFFERKIGGYTGDTLGAVQQLSEIGFYLGLVAWL